MSEAAVVGTRFKPKKCVVLRWSGPHLRCRDVGTRYPTNLFFDFRVGVYFVQVVHSASR